MVFVTVESAPPPAALCSDWLLLPPPRPVEEGSTPPGRGVLSMQDLSHGVIRIDSEEKLSVLTLQDVGSVMPGGESAAPPPQNQNQNQIQKQQRLQGLSVCLSVCSSDVCGESRRTPAALQGR